MASNDPTAVNNQPAEKGVPDAAETSVDRFEHEIEALEGVGRKHRWVYWVVGIILAGAAATVLFIAGTAPPPKPKVESIGNTPPLELMVPRPGRLSDAPIDFRWESVSGRNNYTFKLVRRDTSTTIVDRTLKETSVRLVPEETAKLVKGGSYQWQVSALSKSGTALAAGKSNFDL
jgi:hypothetical protein